MMCLCSKHLHHMNRYGRILKRIRFDKMNSLKEKGIMTYNLRQE